MERTQIIAELIVIFRTTLHNDRIVISENTTPSDLDEWDSLNHAQLLYAVEKHFNVKFSLKEMVRFKSVGNICDAIEAKLAG
jgi:acyl carrier protein